MRSGVNAPVQVRALTLLETDERRVESSRSPGVIHASINPSRNCGCRGSSNRCIHGIHGSVRQVPPTRIGPSRTEPTFPEHTNPGGPGYTHRDPCSRGSQMTAGERRAHISTSSRSTTLGD